MRIWDIPPRELCRNHLLGELGELHVVWNIITMRKQGYGNHPEVSRWRGKLMALYLRHQSLAGEKRQRGTSITRTVNGRSPPGRGRMNTWIL